jgi:two-component system nitrogen regulation sensor histidine kinase GlnL
VAKLVAGHGGVVDFDSAPGRTEFRVLLPAAHELEGAS